MQPVDSANRQIIVMITGFIILGAVFLVALLIAGCTSTKIGDSTHDAVGTNVGALLMKDPSGGLLVELDRNQTDALAETLRAVRSYFFWRSIGQIADDAVDYAKTVDANALTENAQNNALTETLNNNATAVDLAEIAAESAEDAAP